MNKIGQKWTKMDKKQTQMDKKGQNGLNKASLIWKMCKMD